MTILTLENLVSYISEYSPKPSFTTVSLRAALVKEASSVSLCLLLLSRDGNSRCGVKARGLNRYLCTGKPAEVTPILQPNLRTMRVRPQDHCLGIMSLGTRTSVSSHPKKICPSNVLSARDDILSLGTYHCLVLDPYIFEFSGHFGDFFCSSPLRSDCSGDSDQKSSSSSGVSIVSWIPGSLFE
jgi:hypothetical protein